MPPKPPAPGTGEINELPRRGFLRRAVAFLTGALVTLGPAVPAALFFLDPLTRRKRAVGMTGDAIDPEGFIRVTSQDALSDDGLPRAFKVVADLQDFWNKFPSTEIGSVYLRKQEGRVTCFNSRCPHLGCTVKFEPDQQHFACPCHASAFSLDGVRTNNIPPRNMDELECKVDDAGMVWVKFQKFRAGIPEKVPV